MNDLIDILAIPIMFIVTLAISTGIIELISLFPNKKIKLKKEKIN